MCVGVWGTPSSSQSRASSRWPLTAIVRREMAMKQHPPSQGVAAGDRAAATALGHRITVPTSNGFVLCSFQPTFATLLRCSTKTRSSAALLSEARERDLSSSENHRHVFQESH